MKSTTRIRRSAFTLIELLTVIAIIAVLAAIIFPVFGAVRENSRRTSCMSHLQQITTAVKQYELDNRKYPDFLFAPALLSDGAGGCAIYNNAGNANDPNNGKPIVTTASSEAACTMEQASGTGKLGGTYVDSNGNIVGVGSLYPEYVKSMDTFHCPDNSWFDTTGSKGFDASPTSLPDYPVTPAVTRYNTTTTTSATLTDKNTVRFYKYDSYDSNPVINKAANGSALPSIRAAQGNWQMRYARQWMNGVANPTISTNLNSLPTQNRAFYDKQLLWRNPSDDTVVTMCDFHAVNGKVVVVYLSGTAKAYDLKVLTDKGLPVTAASDFDAFRMTP